VPRDSARFLPRRFLLPLYARLPRCYSARDFIPPSLPQVRHLAPFSVQRHSTRLNTAAFWDIRRREVGRPRAIRRKGTRDDRALYIRARAKSTGCRKCRRDRMPGSRVCVCVCVCVCLRRGEGYEHNSLKYSSALARSCLVPVINELKFGVATLLPTTSLPPSLPPSLSLARASSVVARPAPPRPAVRLPAPISRAPRRTLLLAAGRKPGARLFSLPIPTPNPTPPVPPPASCTVPRKIISLSPWLGLGSCCCSCLPLFLPLLVPPPLMPLTRRASSVGHFHLAVGRRGGGEEGRKTREGSSFIAPASARYPPRACPRSVVRGGIFSRIRRFFPSFPPGGGGNSGG